MTWNIRHGGGAPGDAICDFLSARSGGLGGDLFPSLSTIILTEFRANETGEKIQASLGEAGFHHQAVPPTTSPKQNTVLLASRLPFKSQTFPDLGEDTNRCIKAEFDDLVLYGLYFALNAQKIPLFEFLCTLNSDVFETRALLIGDFNTGMNGGVDHEGAKFTAADQFERLQDLGWVDTWRSRHPEAREFSWYSQKGGKPLNGFRIDQALATPKLDREIKSVEYLHDVRMATAACAPLSDHSAMILEL